MSVPWHEPDKALTVQAEVTLSMEDVFGGNEEAWRWFWTYSGAEAQSTLLTYLATAVLGGHTGLAKRLARAFLKDADVQAAIREFEPVDVENFLETEWE